MHILFKKNCCVLSFPGLWTLSIERIWFWFLSILNGVTLKISNTYTRAFNFLWKTRLRFFFFFWAGDGSCLFFVLFCCCLKESCILMYKLEPSWSGVIWKFGFVDALLEPVKPPVSYSLGVMWTFTVQCWDIYSTRLLSNRNPWMSMNYVLSVAQSRSRSDSFRAGMHHAGWCHLTVGTGDILSIGR